MNSFQTQLEAIKRNLKKSSTDSEGEDNKRTRLEEDFETEDEIFQALNMTSKWFVNWT